MTEPTLAGFFSSGGKAAKFPTIGTTIKGTITQIHPPEPQTDIKTRQPIPGKTQVRIELSTNQRDPDIDNDDGNRTLYVRGWMTGAIGQALRKAGATQPQQGATLSLTYIGDGTPTQPGFDGPKQYIAEYTPPNGTANFFNPTSETPPAGIDPETWNSMPEEAKKAIRSLKGAKVIDNDPPPF
jgi:hypothetical protein